ncbi:MAG: hypothetical protein UT34_C0001G0427 [candidate division WS6 bacterium GW2011_GWF2_39_15]|uniref:16S rRNA (guanine(1405)-N(7))-methyltransferase n=1 Tax=candidate division WS6 bacterium GW2011_GWF2_39_15 TaxID=1619100 RepID=A0A0G0QXL6_9BACT|nr:MAG: hypothetical protein UT34_C0001G0427 [candidate division WS6 bacterium GW2011_GWF2_39_15]
MIDIVNRIYTSKKYKGINEGVIKRIVNGLENKYKKEKDIEENARALLHQIWGAYYSSRPDFRKLSKNFLESPDKRSFLINTLRIHSSTNERIDDYEMFLDWVFEKTGDKESFYDAGCGLNPLFFVLDTRFHTKRMVFSDIDVEEIEFLKVVFDHFKLSNFKAEVGDIFIDFPKADVVMMLKLLPVIEQQERGGSVDIIKKMKFKNLIVSYPTKSIGGMEKGMVSSYSSIFGEIAKKSQLKIVSRLESEREIFFMCEK